MAGAVAEERLSNNVAIDLGLISEPIKFVHTHQGH